MDRNRNCLLGGREPQTCVVKLHDDETVKSYQSFPYTVSIAYDF